MPARSRSSPDAPERRSAWEGIAGSVLAVAACTALIYPLREVAPVQSLGVAYLVGVVFVAARWGARLGVLTTFMSAVAFVFFHLPPAFVIAIKGSRDWAAMGVFVIAALLAVIVSNLSGRVRVAEALRREERESGRRMLTAADEERRRVVRDLHDGAQQRLVHTVVTLQLARAAVEEDRATGQELVGEALEHAERALVELRELAHGVLPGALTHGGLGAAVASLVPRVSLPVIVDVCADRLPAPIEATAYFVVAEALTNAVKHADATSARVSASLERGVLRVEVRDDGRGGARLDGGSGLLGLRDRVAALDGRLEVHSRAGEGTVLVATLPAAPA